MSFYTFAREPWRFLRGKLNQQGMGLDDRLKQCQQLKITCFTSFLFGRVYKSCINHAQQ